MKYFTSDLHFNHKSIIDFCPGRIKMMGINPEVVKKENECRHALQKNKQAIKKESRKNPKSELREVCPLLVKAHEESSKELMRQHNEGIVRLLNKYVKKRDTLYIIGDFAFGAIGEAKKWLLKLNGRKVLILGNHDRNARVMFEMGFQDVFENHQIKLDDIKVNLSHFPYLPSWYHRLRHWVFYRKNPDKRYLHKRIYDTGKWLLHGHTHDQEVMAMGKRSIHVGIDAWGRPVSEKEIIKIIRNKTKVLPKLSDKKS